MKVRIRTKQLTVTVASLVMLLGIAGLIQSLAPPVLVAESSEAGFVSLSPRGVEGGFIVPASCESGVWNSTWDWAHPDGNNSGICAPTTCQDPSASNNGGPLPCTYLPAPTLYFSPASVPYGAGSTVVWSWPETGGTRYCDVRTYGSEWNGFANGQNISGSYNPGGMNASGSATATCYWYSPSISSYLASPQANATLIVGARNACYPIPNPANYGASCTSSANACGSTNSGTINCSGACTASTPANPSGYSSACTSSANACGSTNTGTINCSGACTASTPANPSGYGNACTSAANACGSTNSGTINCSGACTASTPANPSGYGTACTSSANRCGMTNTGTIQCNGSCSASEPSNSACNGRSCTAANACGNTDGTYQGNGVCAPPANPSGYGSACTSSANACGQTNSGTIQCNGSCSVGAPANPSGYGSACSLTSAANACGQTTSASTGAYNCSGACTGTPPAAPAVTIPGGNAYGAVCTSPANACGQTQANGTWQCNGSCSSTAPSNASCPTDLIAGTPTISPASGMSVGQSISLSSLISNIAFGPANGSFPNIFRINTSSLLGGSSINGLGAGASANTTASYTPTSAGTYTVSACTDNNTSWQGSITESNEGNNCSADASFTATACTTSLTSTPSTIEQGQSTTFSWSPSSSYCGFTSCIFADGASYGGGSGSRTVSPSTTSTYGLSCVGPYNPAPGTATSYTTVTVLVPTATISASPQRVQVGTNTTVSWSSTNSASCAITRSPASSGWPKSGLNSSGTTDTITTQTVYRIDCVNNYGTHATASAMVNVVPVFEEF